MRTRILLADDHVVVREGIRKIIEARPGLAVVAEVSTGVEAAAAAERVKPDVAVLDIAMTQLNGIEATYQVKSKSPRTAVLILSMYGDERHIRSAVKAGASGYVLKDCLSEDLIGAIETVRQGNAFFNPSIAAKLIARPPLDETPHDAYDLLTQRERTIYVLLAGGRVCKDIAELLGLSPRTVDTHRTHIMAKLKLHSAVELTLSAVRRGLIV